LDIFFADQLSTANQRKAETLQIELRPHTLNHYYNDTIKQLSKEGSTVRRHSFFLGHQQEQSNDNNTLLAIASVERSDEDTRTGKLNMSNQDAAAVDQTIKLHRHRRVASRSSRSA
jgi:hypothetical protein